MKPWRDWIEPEGPEDFVPLAILTRSVYRGLTAHKVHHAVAAYSRPVSLGLGPPYERRVKQPLHIGYLTYKETHPTRILQ